MSRSIFCWVWTLVKHINKSVHFTLLFLDTNSGIDDNVATKIGSDLQLGVGRRPRRQLGSGRRCDRRCRTCRSWKRSGREVRRCWSGGEARGVNGSRIQRSAGCWACARPCTRPWRHQVAECFHRLKRVARFQREEPFVRPRVGSGRIRHRRSQTGI